MSFVYFISSDKVGNQDPELGGRLMTSLFTNLLGATEKPTHILFVERGVKLVLPESPAINALKIMENEYGVELLACGTCLDFFGIRERMDVGQICSMPDIISIMHESYKVIHI